MNKPTVQDIFNRFYPAYIEQYSPSAIQMKTAHNIINCKTGAYGSNISICEDCGKIHIHHNSCRNRCCPMCQAIPKELWMDARREDVLDAPYFHLVFTVPDILNPVILSNQKLLYDALYHAASATIDELATDTKYLGAKVGYICILHTWGSEMNFHPHIHTILLGGGLTAKNQWKDNGNDFFLPIQVISKVFRGKYLDELKLLWKEEKLQFYGSSEKYRNHYVFQELLDTCYTMEWVPYCKKTFNGAQSVINYLGKYTHRIAISNYRIISMDEQTVTFSVKDYHNEGKWKNLTLSGIEFIRRFLMHVPPKRFVRIRHYGLLCSRTKNKKLTICRNLLGCQKYLSKLREMEMPQMLEHLYGIKACICKTCGGHLGKPQKRLPLRC
ncbi:MAG: IS91 family transposase [Roseburia sp.]|nr:IS91 family transposase [Roseburia sp.]